MRGRKRECVKKKWGNNGLLVAVALAGCKRKRREKFCEVGMKRERERERERECCQMKFFSSSALFIAQSLQ